MSIDPISNPGAFDVVVIGGMTTPGIATVGAPSPAYKWDVKSGPGTSGGTITYQGNPPRSFTIEVTIWQKEHFGQLDELRAMIAPAEKGLEPPAYDIAHPSLSKVGIRSVVCEDFPPESKNGKGLWKTSIKFIEYRPAKKRSVVSTPRSSKGLDDIPALYRDESGEQIASYQAPEPSMSVPDP